MERLERALPKSRHFEYLEPHPFCSASSERLRRAATSGVAPSAVKKFSAVIEKRGIRSTTNGNVSWSGKVASRVIANWYRRKSAGTASRSATVAVASSSTPKDAATLYAAAATASLKPQAPMRRGKWRMAKQATTR